MNCTGCIHKKICELWGKAEGQDASCYDDSCKETLSDILGDDYDLDRLRELVEADRDGRCVVLPCKIGDTLYRIQRFKRGKNWRKEAEYIRTAELNKNNFWRVVFEGELGESVFLTREAAEAALKGEQHG